MNLFGWFRKKEEIPPVSARLLKSFGNWRDVADSANTTVNREAGTKEPSTKWKKRMLLSEHSPIRQLQFKIRWEFLRYWVSVHFVRHKFGIEHWVRTQRTDRTKKNRDKIGQGARVEHEFLANAQTLIYISRKRKCFCAAEETREAWGKALNEIKFEQPELFAACVPDCIYRGYCYEMKSCGFFRTEAYKKWLAEYREGINDGETVDRR